MPSRQDSSCLLASLCIRCMSGFPVIFVVGLLGWAYYAYVVVMCGQLIDSIVQRALLGFVFTALWILLLVAYYKAINTPAGQPPPQFYLSGAQVAEYEGIVDDDKEQEIAKKKELLLKFGETLPVHNRLANGGLRYCGVCKLIKPDRAHHCSLCKTCVLKMDHHCPWVNNCVGHGNYKFFILFLFYTTLFCLFTAFSVLPVFITSWSTIGSHHSHSGDKMGVTNSTVPGDLSTPQRLQIIFLFFLAAVFCFSVSFLHFFHLYLLTHNNTTLENGRAPLFTYGQDAKGYHLGTRRNIQQVMGMDTLFWILPFGHSMGNGYEFPMRKKAGGGEADRLLSAADERGGAGALSGEESDRV